MAILLHVKVFYTASIVWNPSLYELHLWSGWIFLWQYSEVWHLLSIVTVRVTTNRLTQRVIYYCYCGWKFLVWEVTMLKYQIAFEISIVNVDVLCVYIKLIIFTISLYLSFCWSIAMGSSYCVYTLLLAFCLVRIIIR